MITIPPTELLIIMKEIMVITHEMNKQPSKRRISIVKDQKISPLQFWRSRTRKFRNPAAMTARSESVTPG